MSVYLKSFLLVWCNLYHVTYIVITNSIIRHTTKPVNESPKEWCEMWSLYTIDLYSEIYSVYYVDEVCVEKLPLFTHNGLNSQEDFHSGLNVSLTACDCRSNVIRECLNPEAEMN